MGIHELPVVYRVVRWFERRRSLCQECFHMPAIDGPFCSAECEQNAVETQAHGG
jgi:hypothetical protein